MQFDPDFVARLKRCVLLGAQNGSSDFDLNTGLPGPKVPDELTPAAVLIGVRMMGQTPCVTLTKRTAALKHHPGQIAFPGGKCDPADNDLTETALREADEEIGLHRQNVTVLGALAPHETVTGFSVTPVLALICDDFEPVAQPGEVADVFDVPFVHLMDPSKARIEGRIWHGHRRRYYVIPFGPYYIWGATARMLVGLRSVWDQTA